MKNFILILITAFAFIGCSTEKKHIREGREMWKAYFKKMLKDPNSLVIYNEEYVDSGLTVIWDIEYGAKNGFGGMVRERKTFKTVGYWLTTDHQFFDKEDLITE